MVSPARGEHPHLHLHPLHLSLHLSFHSIGFPCERGDYTCWMTHSVLLCFHSIGFPCERGALSSSLVVFFCTGVSIQLVSPARGERGPAPPHPPFIAGKRIAAMRSRRSYSLSTMSMHITAPMIRTRDGSPAGTESEIFRI